MSTSHIVDHYVESYIRSLLPKSTGLLSELEAYAQLHHTPIVHPEVAQYIRVMIQMNKPTRILEIGTAIGYSASLMAEAMQIGLIETIEIKEDMVAKASETFNTLKGIVPNVELIQHHGDAAEVIDNLSGSYDMIFIDASKGHYKSFFDKCIPLLSPKGVIISDNVLYKGMVATNEYLVRRKITIVKRMRAYLSYISDHSMFETTVLPLGDGLAISYKKEAKAHD